MVLKNVKLSNNKEGNLSFSWTKQNLKCAKNLSWKDNIVFTKESNLLLASKSYLLSLYLCKWEILNLYPFKNKDQQHQVAKM